MAEVLIPFLARFRVPMIEGRKTMTCRTKSYGQPGDSFVWFYYRFRLTIVRQAPLGLIAQNHWFQEGCSSQDDFKQVWRDIHPTRGYDPGQIVWVHEFVRDGPL